MIGGEQIELPDWMFGSADFGDGGGAIFPGITEVGGLWFGIKHSEVPDITRMVIETGGPAREELSSAGEDFELDLSNHEQQPLPEELQ